MTRTVTRTVTLTLTLALTLAPTLALMLAACAASPPAQLATPSGDFGVLIAGDKIASLPAVPAADAVLWPPVIDSHVHLAFWPVADRLAAAGVEVAVDLAAPEDTLRPDGGSGLHLLAAGPMLTRPGGYPLDSWGADGFGLPCGDAACVTAAVDRLAARGARVIKLAGDDGGLAPELVPVAVAAAHAHHLRVAIHALSDASAALAARAGVDLLAHTPVEPLAPATIAAWRGRAVISTLAAFGGSPDAVANLRALRAAGVTVLYGTDLGNLRDAGPSADEIALLRRAGLDDAAITAAMTTMPAAYWGIELTPAPGREATFLVLSGDPRQDATRLLTPRAVYLRGRHLSASPASAVRP